MGFIPKPFKKAVVFSNIVLGSLIILFGGGLFFLNFRPVFPFSFIVQSCGLITILTLFFAFGLKEERKTSIALSTFSLIGCLFCIEVVMEFGPQKYINIGLAKKEGRIFDTRKRFEVVRDLKNQGFDAWPQLNPKIFLKQRGLGPKNKKIFPLSGISGKKTVYCNENGEYTIYDSDEYGFNNNRGLYKTGAVDIILVGDSFANGACVQPGEDVTGQLRHNGLRALNFGMGGNGPLLELAAISEFVRPLKPSIVLWLYYEENDLLELLEEKKSPLLTSYLQDDFNQNLYQKQDTVDRLLREYVDQMKSKEKTVKIKYSWGRVVRLVNIRTRLGLALPKPIPPFMLFHDILEQAIKRVDAWGGELYFVYLPGFTRHQQTRSEDEDLFYRSKVLSIVNELRIPVIDFEEVLASRNDPLSLFPLRVHGHYNAAGYSLLADLIIKGLKEK